jgi:hypothetical protein
LGVLRVAAVATAGTASAATATVMVVHTCQQWEPMTDLDLVHVCPGPTAVHNCALYNNTCKNQPIQTAHRFNHSIMDPRLAPSCCLAFVSGALEKALCRASWVCHNCPHISSLGNTHHQGGCPQHEGVLVAGLGPICMHKGLSLRRAAGTMKCDLHAGNGGHASRAVELHQSGEYYP